MSTNFLNHFLVADIPPACSGSFGLYESRSVIINHMLSTGSLSHGKPLLSRAYQFLLIALAPVPPLSLCHPKLLCHLSRWQQATHTRPEPVKQAWLEKFWYPVVKESSEKGKQGQLLIPTPPIFLLVTLSSLCQASELQASLFPCWGSLQLSVRCLIGGSSMEAACICYLFVPISRCEALQPTLSLCVPHANRRRN